MFPASLEKSGLKDPHSHLEAIAEVAGLSPWGAPGPSSAWFDGGREGGREGEKETGACGCSGPDLLLSPPISDLPSTFKAMITAQTRQTDAASGVPRGVVDTAKAPGLSSTDQEERATPPEGFRKSSVLFCDLPPEKG